MEQANGACRENTEMASELNSGGLKLPKITGAPFFQYPVIIIDSSQENVRAFVMRFWRACIA